MEDSFKKSLTSAMLGAASMLLLACLGLGARATVHFFHEDAVVTSSAERLSKAEDRIQQITVEFTAYKADHDSLKEMVKSNHAEEMEAIHELNTAAITRAAKLAILNRMSSHSLPEQAPVLADMPSSKPAQKMSADEPK